MNLGHIESVASYNSYDTIKWKFKLLYEGLFNIWRKYILSTCGTYSLFPLPNSKQTLTWSGDSFSHLISSLNPGIKVLFDLQRDPIPPLMRVTNWTYQGKL